MDPKSDDEIQEMMEEFSQDLGRNLGNEDRIQHQRPSFNSTFKENPIMWCALAIAILLSLFSLFSNNNSDSFSKDPNYLKTRLDSIEKQITVLEEGLTEKSSALDQIYDIKQSISKLSGSEKTLNGNIKNLNAGLSTLRKELESIKKGAQNQEGKAVQKTAPVTGLRQYTVKKGDTLYSISQKRNISVDELRKLNKLKKDQDIFPGQKMNVP